MERPFDITYIFNFVLEYSFIETGWVRGAEEQQILWKVFFTNIGMECVLICRKTFAYRKGVVVPPVDH